MTAARRATAHGSSSVPRRFSGPARPIGSAGRAELLAWAVRVGVVTAPALAARDGTGTRSAGSRLAGAAREGLFVPSRPLRDWPALFTPTAAGLRACGRDGPAPRPVRAGGARHAALCASLAVALERRYTGHLVVGERELAEMERGAERTLASAMVGAALGRHALRHRPDLVLWPRADPAALPIAVELELTVKAPARLAAICRGWARARCVSGVLYLAAPSVVAPLRRAVARSGAGDRIAVIEAVAPLRGAREISPVTRSVAGGGSNA